MVKRKSQSDPKPVDYSEFFIAGKTPAPVESFGVPGKSYPVSSDAVKTTNVNLRPSDTGVFRGGSTPLGTSLALTKTDRRSVVGASLLVTSLPAVAGSVPAVVGGKIMQTVLKRYAAPIVTGAVEATWSAASKGLDTIGVGGKLYEANTVLGPVLASTKIASTAQTAARLSNLESNAIRITRQASRGAMRGATNMVNDLKIGKKVVKGAAGLAGVYAIKSNKKK